MTQVIILICLAGMAPADCKEDTAKDKISQIVPAGADCTMYGQTVLAQTTLLTDGTYPKFICPRKK